jgi:hypothetical protein
MSPSKLRTLLSKSFAHKQKVLIKGPPGAGKTAIITQAAADAGADLLLSHPAVSDPTDYKGMPAIVNGGAEFLPFGDLNRLIQASKLTVCCFDDLGQAPPSVQAALMQPLHGRRINGHKISDDVVFVGATNDTKDQAGVAGLLEPVKSRWDTIVSIDVSVDDWCIWALDNNIPAELIAFIRFRPALLNNFQPTRQLTNSPCPRTVAAVGKWLAIGETSHDVIAGAAGEGFATELVAFLAMFSKLPNLDSILMNPDSASVPDDMSALYAVTAGLARKATPGNADRLFRYLGRLPKEFSTCCVTDAVRINKAIETTKPYVDWCVRNTHTLA